MTNATMTTATYYSLSIEIIPHTGETGQTLTTVDLIATDATTGRRWAYCGSAPCSTQGEALELMARIFDWEYRSGRTLDPTRKPTCWAAESVPAEGRPMVASGPEVACTPSVWGPKAPVNVVEVVEVVEAVEAAPVAPVVEAAPAVKARKPRARRVDAAKARRAKVAGKAVAEAEMVGVG